MAEVAPAAPALTLDAEQAHWNVTGPAYLPLHHLMEELAADTRGWADRAGERTIALGFAADARPATVAAVAVAVAVAYPNGRVADHEAITSSKAVTPIQARCRRGFHLLEVRKQRPRPCPIGVTRSPRTGSASSSTMPLAPTLPIATSSAPCVPGNLLLRLHSAPRCAA